MTTYRLSSIVTRIPSQYESLPVWGPEGEPLRALLRDSDDATVAYVRSDAGPVTVGHLTAEQVAERLAGDDYQADEIRETL